MRLRQMAITGAMLAAFFGGTLPSARAAGPGLIQQHFGLTPTQVQELRATVRHMARVMDDKREPEPAASPAKTPAAQSHATTGQAAAKALGAVNQTGIKLADRALVMADRAGTSIAGAVSKVAPKFWRIMVLQQYAKAASVLTVPVGLLLAIMVIRIRMRKHWVAIGAHDHCPYDCGICFSDGVRIAFTQVIPFVMMAAFAIWGAVELKETAKYLINPEYYAVRDILVLFLNPRAALLQ